ncbi:MAG TPA: glycine cleavage T C-terminal barrel domain-containing protein [Solirubrobacterales bacterium]|jgi:folate-binding protein YgfZ
MAEAPTVELDAQYRQLREECGLLDRGDRGKILVSGPDATEYLQGQLTNDVEALAEDEGCYAALLDRKGHLQSDLRVLRLSNGIWLDLEPGPSPTVLSHLRTYSIGREVEIEDVTEAWAILSLIGPRAAELAGLEGIGPEHSQRHRRWEGVEVLGVATALGVDLIARAEDSGPLRELALAAGAVEVGEQAAEIVRIESGTPRFGAEMSTETMPAEAGIVDAAVSFTKGCYIGQEPVARLHYKGRPNRHLRGLELSGPAEPGAELRLGERAVGSIGSSCVSPARGPIALAVVRREAEPGAELAVGEAGVTARVVDLPFG